MRWCEGALLMIEVANQMSRMGRGNSALASRLSTYFIAGAEQETALYIAWSRILPLLPWRHMVQDRYLGSVIGFKNGL